MKHEVAVLVPVLGRPERAAALIGSLEQTEPRALPVFLCSPGDDAEVEAVERAGQTAIEMAWQPGQGDYAKKINYGFRITESPWVLLAADDLVFHSGWFDAALAVHESSNACVIGTNDLGNRTVMSGLHSTHTLVHRDYSECGTVDEHEKLLHEGYWHNWVDNEFIETAKWRQTFAFARESHIEHLHPFWNKAEGDATYRRGQEHFDEDHRLFVQRKRLWSR